MGGNKYPQGSCLPPFRSDGQSVGFVLITISHHAVKLEPCRPSQNEQQSRMTPWSLNLGMIHD